MEFHPDRNYGNVEEMTRRFADVQSAYSVLSDPQERAWYDSHRQDILRDDSEPFHDDYKHHTTDTTAEDIMRMYRRFNDQIIFTDAPSGFFGGLRMIFETLATEETVASERQGLDPIEFPSFGYAEDDFKNVVRLFYATWSSFSTRKAFSWREKYRLSDAPDRRVRRMMEKENRRVREEAIHEYNDCVRSMVAFIRKRDPRCKSNVHDEAERQKNLRDAALAQAARSREANRVKNTRESEIPQWSKTVDQSAEGSIDEEIDKQEDEVHCVVCNKTFKSEKQYESHERSKKHIRAVRQIRSTMHHENITLGLNQEPNVVASNPSIPDVAVSPANVVQESLE